MLHKFLLKELLMLHALCDKGQIPLHYPGRRPGLRPGLRPGRIPVASSIWPITHYLARYQRASTS